MPQGVSMRLNLLTLSVAVLVAGCASVPPEADPVQLKLNDLDARITRIERIVANQVEAAQRLDEAQSAVRQLRGRLEELEHGHEALAENAKYWLGEAYYVNHDYEAAAGAFRTVLKKWPDSRKAPDALLKLGYTQYAQRQYSAARATLTEVMRKYPGSDSAKLAADRLHRTSTSPSQ